MCDGTCMCKKHREQIEARIKELVGSLDSKMSPQDFFTTKSEILGLIDEID